MYFLGFQKHLPLGYLQSLARDDEENPPVVATIFDNVSALRNHSYIADSMDEERMKMISKTEYNEESTLGCSSPCVSRRL